ncbi:PucR family transcriptional regulator [Amycolatopsis sp. K13G38]|uniref:PucR family transcriptional regulator n=1 Tax=Amycolatopsis acididurans TaxID=2724524 RepID=A0ABX1J3Z3_9PSEU|nr:helix-turn-helix domain-containing protein [Amycolatopsis acididurans]NKQ53017.1 PucR family transcriptional regulator [Amycolatopsis acididurans]
MRYQGAEPAVAELAAAVWARMPDMIESTYAKIIDEMAVYRDETFVSHRDLWVSCDSNLSFLLRALEKPEPPDLSKAAETGRERARQGAPLPEMLRAFRIGFTEVWQRFVDFGGDDTATVVVATRAIWALMDDYIEVLTTTYRQTLAEITRRDHERRLALVEALFAGGTATEGTLWDIARVLDLNLDGTFLVVAAETPSLGREPLPGMEKALRDRHHASAWRLSPDLQVGVVSLRDPSAADPVMKLLKENATGRIGVSPVFTGLGNTARALHLARVALSSLMPGTPGIVQFTESPLAGLVASDPEASAQLAHQVLRPVLALPREDRNVLLLTLRAWFDCGGSTKLTAERVYCHPNTVRHRLKRITEELGRSLSDPADVAELGTALRALSMFPDAAHLPAVS